MGAKSLKDFHRQERADSTRLRNTLAELDARGSALKGSKTAEDRAAGPAAKGNQSYGGRGRAFRPGMIPSWDRQK